jgi:hypothetical protein
MMRPVQMRIEHAGNQELGAGELVAPAHEDALSPPDLDSRAGELSGIGPQRRGRQVAVELLADEPHWNVIERAPVALGLRRQLRTQPRQRIDELAQPRALHPMAAIVRLRRTCRQREPGRQAASEPQHAPA